MKLKNLRKKVQRLEKRLREGSKKLAKLKEKLKAAEAAKAMKAARKSAGRAAKAAKPSRPIENKSPTPATGAKKLSSAKKAKKKLNLSPERRAQLAAAMKARWAAKRAAEANATTAPAGHDFAVERTTSAPESPQGGA